MTVKELKLQLQELEESGQEDYVVLAWDEEYEEWEPVTCVDTSSLKKSAYLCID